MSSTQTHPSVLQALYSPLLPPSPACLSALPQPSPTLRQQQQHSVFSRSCSVCLLLIHAVISIRRCLTRRPTGCSSASRAAVCCWFCATTEAPWRNHCVFVWRNYKDAFSPGTSGPSEWPEGVIVRNRIGPKLTKKEATKNWDCLGTIVVTRHDEAEVRKFSQEWVSALLISPFTFLFFFFFLHLCPHGTVRTIQYPDRHTDVSSPHPRHRHPTH